MSVSPRKLCQGCQQISVKNMHKKKISMMYVCKDRTTSGIARTRTDLSFIKENKYDIKIET